MNLVQEYLSLAADVVSFCDHDKDHICKQNNKITRMRSIAARIERSDAEMKDAFLQLLRCDNSEIRLWVAHHILEVMNYDQSYRKVALRIIRRKAKTTNGFGERIWLSEWYKSHPKDRWIL